MRGLAVSFSYFLGGVREVCSTKLGWKPRKTRSRTGAAAGQDTTRKEEPTRKAFHLQEKDGIEA